MPISTKKGPNVVNQSYTEDPSEGLSIQQERFVNEYVVAPIGTQAAILAGYSPKNAGVAANSLLKSPKIREAIKKRLKKRYEKAALNADQILAKLGDIANADSTLAVKDGKLRLKDLSELPAEYRQAVQSIKKTKSGFEVRFYNKLEALKLSGQFHRLFTDKKEIDISEDMKKILQTQKDDAEKALQDLGLVD